MICCREKSDPNLLAICDTCVDCVYLIGSRARGEELPTSDHDIIIVVNNEELWAQLPSRSWKNFRWLHDHGWVPRIYSESTHSNVFKECKRDYIECDDPSFNCWIYNHYSFSKMIEYFVPFAVECLFLPTRAIWREKFQFNIPPTLIPRNVEQCFVSFTQVAEAHRERSMLEFNQKNKREKINQRTMKLQGKMRLKPSPVWSLLASKKALIFSIRMIYLGVQLLESGKIMDYGAAQHVKQEILHVSGTCWVEHETIFTPLYHEALRLFTSAKEFLLLKIIESEQRAIANCEEALQNCDPTAPPPPSECECELVGADEQQSEGDRISEPRTYHRSNERKRNHSCVTEEN